MNKIYKIVWNAAQQAWVVVSELARGHVKASATSTALTAVAAGTLVWSLSTQPANAWKYLGISDDGKSLLATNICIGGVCYTDGTAVQVDVGMTLTNGNWRDSVMLTNMSKFANNYATIYNAVNSTGRAMVELSASTFNNSLTPEQADALLAYLKSAGLYSDSPNQITHVSSDGYINGRQGTYIHQSAYSPNPSNTSTDYADGQVYVSVRTGDSKSKTTGVSFQNSTTNTIWRVNSDGSVVNTGESSFSNSSWSYKNGVTTNSSANYSVHAVSGGPDTYFHVNSTITQNLGKGGSSLGATGINAMALGPNASAAGNHSIAQGVNANATGNFSIAQGYNVSALGNNSIATGVNATATGANNTALGAFTKANGSQTVALGYDSLANGSQVVAISGTVSGNNSVVVQGLASSWSGSLDRTVVINGEASSNNASYSTAINGYAHGVASTAIGSFSGYNPFTSQVEADKSIAYGENSVALNSQVYGDNLLGIGSRIGTENGRIAYNFVSNTTAIGMNSESWGDENVVLGANAVAGRFNHSSVTDKDVMQATALGANTFAKGNGSLAAGYNASVTGNQSISVGYNSNVTGNQSIAIGVGNQVHGDNSGAFGDPSIINANASYSIGNNNTLATGLTGVFALGNDIKNTANNSVFLGSNSAYTAADSNTTAGITNATGVISVGNISANQTRRIQGLAEGLVSANSTDAIRGSQLYAAMQNAGSKYVGINSTVAGNRNGQGAKGIDSVALGPNATAGTTASGHRGLIAIGQNATASNIYSTLDSAIAIGTDALAVLNNTTAIGRLANANGENSIAIGLNASTHGSLSLAIGSSASAWEESVAIGSNSSTNRVGVAVGGRSFADYYATAVGHSTRA